MSTDALRPFERLARDWEARRRSPASRDAARALGHAEADIGRLAAADLGDLVDALAARSQASAGPWGERLDRDTAAAVFRAALRSAQVHPLVPRALLQALVPGLVGVGRRLDWGNGGEWPSQDAFTVDAIATAWEVLDEWRGQDRAYAVLDVLSAVRCRLRRRIVRHRSLHRSEHSVSADEGDAKEPRAPGPSDVEELARAIERERRLLDPADACVLYAHRVLGYSLSELSASSGHSRRYLAARRDRAAAALTA